MSSAGWLSLCVVKVMEFSAGSGVFLGISWVMTPPTVSMPSVSGVTSISTGAEPSPKPPLNAAAWMAAPCATASSGLMPRTSSFPPKNSRTSCWTFGMRVEPPTSTMSSTSSFFTPPSCRTCCTMPRVRLKRSTLISSNFARVKVPVNSKSSTEKRACGVLLSCRLTRSASRRNFARASAPSTERPCFFSNTLEKCRTTPRSKFSPPKRLSPPVARTSKVPSLILSSDASKVPPPKS
mmetsp:Transcript_115796/g.321995  ORF Transcript_115796/g.321995 Transcript_115796/m.321995 type:complete len:237 (+) Transcript_115796:683-1393(+)